MQKIVDILNNSKIKLIIVGVLLVIFIIIMGSSMLKKDKNEPETPVPEKSIVITNKLKKKFKINYTKLKIIVIVI